MSSWVLFCGCHYYWIVDTRRGNVCSIGPINSFLASVSGQHVSLYITYVHCCSNNTAARIMPNGAITKQGFIPFLELPPSPDGHYYKCPKLLMILSWSRQLVFSPPSSSLSLLSPIHLSPAQRVIGKENIFLPPPNTQHTHIRSQTNNVARGFFPSTTIIVIIDRALLLLLHTHMMVPWHSHFWEYSVQHNRSPAPFSLSLSLSLLRLMAQKWF